MNGRGLSTTGEAHPGLPRAVEGLLAAVAVVALAPLLAIAALGVRLSSPGPILFRQRRVGRHGEPFTLYKFRSMRVGRPGAAVTAASDQRITAAGRILRRTKLDELPELWNIVRGEMSFVGPRPEVPEFVDLGDERWRRVLAVRPGLTDPVTLRLRNEEQLLAEVGGDTDDFYSELLVPYKLRGYLDYLARRSAWSDLGVILQTILGVLLPGRNPPPSLTEIRDVLREDS